MAAGEWSTSGADPYRAYPGGRGFPARGDGSSCACGSRLAPLGIARSGGCGPPAQERIVVVEGHVGPVEAEESRHLDPGEGEVGV
jgi:hypothetical protein